VVIALLAAAAAFIAWNNRPPEPAVPLVAKEAPRKPASTGSADPRDTARERPDRERTSR
jgi:hypothetical protein